MEQKLNLSPLEWKTSNDLVPYEEALAFMDARVEAIHKGEAPECVWLLEHPPLYTAGTSAQSTDLLDPKFPVFKTGRGGEYTYHGPGQRVAYVMLNLRVRQKQPDIKKYIWSLEEWIIRSLEPFGIQGERRDGRVGIWVRMPSPPHQVSLEPSVQTQLSSPRRGEEDYLGEHSELRKSGEGVLIPDKEAKIAAIGVRIRRWVTLHGISINVNPNLSHFSGIVPCGISDHGVTSIAELSDGTMEELDESLQSGFDEIF